MIAALLCIAGYVCLAREGRQPAWHHHVGRPLVASAVMVTVCLALKDVHVLLAVAFGAVAYLLSLTVLGGLKRSDIAAVLGRL